MSFGNSLGNLYIMYTLLEIKSRFTTLNFQVNFKISVGKMLNKETILHLNKCGRKYYVL